MKKFIKLSDTHVQVTDGAISTDGTFYEKVYNFTRIPNEQITMTRYYRYLELCKMVQLGLEFGFAPNISLSAPTLRSICFARSDAFGNPLIVYH